MATTTFIFPYKFKTIQEGKIVDPLIFLPLKTKFGWQNTWFLLDTGADTTMLTLRLAKQYGLHYNLQLKTQLVGIGEKRSTAYFGKIEVKIGQRELQIRCYFIDAEDSTLLLGRLDIFDKFSITFDSLNKQIIFKQI